MSNNRDIEFDYVAYHYVIPFVQRWRTKVRKRKGCDEKNYYFDKFISEYIIFSSLVNVIKPIGVKYKYDKDYCTSVMAEFILAHTEAIGTLIHKMESLVKELVDIIKHENFSIISSGGLNPELEKNWKSEDPKLQLTALLETLYFMRCNLFHGEKEYEYKQVKLLRPACNCINLINKTIVKVYKQVSEE